MQKFVERDGKIVANRAWVMTEAWATIKRFEADDFKMPLSHAMQVAWEDANMEVSVQNNARAKIVYIKALAKVGADRLIEMRNQIENIDRQSFEDKERLSEIRQAMLYV